MAGAATFVLTLGLLSLVVTLPQTWLPGFDDILPEWIIDRPYFEVPILAMTGILLVHLMLIAAVRAGLDRDTRRRLLIAASLALGASVLLTNTGLGDSFSIGIWTIDRTALVFIVLVTVGAFLWASEVGHRGNSTELGAALVSGAVISLVILAVQTQQADIDQAQANEAEIFRIASSRNLQWQNLDGFDLEGAFMPHRDFTGSSLVEVDLEDADLSDSVLVSANLEDADLHESSLLRANLQGANMKGVTLAGADLRATDLRGAQFSPSLDYESLRGVIVSRETRWPDVLIPEKIPDLCVAEGVDREAARPTSARCIIDWAKIGYRSIVVNGDPS